MKKKSKAAIAFRIPGWSKGIPAPGNLYTFFDDKEEKPTLLINGVESHYTDQDGYAVVDREWKDGDIIEYKIPMTIKKVVARNELKLDNNRMALQRGPLVYCVEGADNNGKAWNIVSPKEAVYTTENMGIVNENVVSLVSNLPVLTISDDGLSANTRSQKVRAIPYYSWCNRGSNPMQVWLPILLSDIKINY
jgi:DUF1680 family protein